MAPHNHIGLSQQLEKRLLDQARPDQIEPLFQRLESVSTVLAIGPEKPVSAVRTLFVSSSYTFADYWVRVHRKGLATLLNTTDQEFARLSGARGDKLSLAQAREATINYLEAWLKEQQRK
jgi:hypothetical protein